jgi:hypothetical protein
MTGATALALAAALAAAPLSPAPAAEPGVPPAMRAEDAQPQSNGRDPEGTRQDVALALHSTTFWSKESSHYTFHSLALSYLRSSGASGPFMNLALFFPLQARQDGRVYYAGDIYGKRIGGDFLVGWQWRSQPLGTAEGELGPGLHATFLWLPGETGYSDFTAMPMGVGVQGKMRWKTGQKIGGSYLRLGGFASANADIVDFLRSNDLRFGLTFMAGVAMGLDD